MQIAKLVWLQGYFAIGTFEYEMYQTKTINYTYRVAIRKLRIVVSSNLPHFEMDVEDK